MRYTIILKKVIKEVIGLITIVLFIYTCTKIGSASNRKGAAVLEHMSVNTAVGFGTPAQTTGYHPLLPRHGLTERSPDKRKPGSGSYSAAWYTPGSYRDIGSHSPDLRAGDQATGIVIK